ncbi:hypothetical protein [Nostoc sp.]|uniref:hypothetical protein n=1 Tax=Nostoc sp. TaxID=1180 RepID=UPI002FF82E87
MTYIQKLQQYEQAFTRATQQQYPLNTTQRNQLRQEQQRLGIKNEDVAPIEARVRAEIEAYLQKLQQYEEAFTRATQQQYPLSATQRNQLRQEQQVLGLKDENIAPIENRIQVEIEAYVQKLEQYEQALIQTIEHEYPFSEEVRKELKRYQQILELGDEEVAEIEEKVVRQIEINQTQIQLLSTFEPPEIATQSPIFSSQFVSNQKTPKIKPVKTNESLIPSIVALLLIVVSGIFGLFVKQLRSQPVLPIFSSNSTPTPSPTVSATQPQRTLANLSPGWVIKTNNDISLGNNQSLPRGTFLEVIEKKSNPNPASGSFLVSMRVCANKSTQTPANPNNPAVTTSVPANSKPLPATVLLNSSQVNRFGIVLQSDAPNPCRTVTQPPVTEPSDTSPT